MFQLLLGMFTPFARRARAEGLIDEGGGGFAAGAGAQGTQGSAAKGLRFRLSEGEEQREAAQATATPAPAVRLSEAETERVLRRLPPLKAEESDRQDFNLRERSLPPPRAGATVLSAFPADEGRPGPEQSSAGALEVVRYQPTGQVPLAPQLSVTFSQPMVAVTSQEEAAKTVPAEMTPKPEGRWRWLGTKTLIFDPADMRLPMATEFRVTVPAGTRSAAGGATRAPVSWTFSTPPPQLKAMYPQGGPVRRESLVFMEFDQRVDPSAVLRTVRVLAGRVNARVRLATDAEVDADEAVRNLAKRATQGRWLAVRAGVDEGNAGGALLPADSQVVVTVGPGTPSAEGPRTTTVAQSFSFRTYGPLRVTGHQCGWQRNQCLPSDVWRITFSNPLDREAFDESQVKIEPAAPEAKVFVSGNELYVQGWKRGRTSYRLTLDASIKDEFGQTLSEPVTVPFNVGPAPPSLTAPGGSFVVLEPSGGPRFSVFSVNQPALKVSLYAVGPEDWDAFVAHMRRVNNYYDEKAKQQGPGTPPGRLVYSKTIQVAGQPEEMTETRIDVGEALKGGLGHAVLVVEPTAGKVQERQAVRAWVQVTNIGLGAFVDRTDMLLWATSLADGRPLPGVEMWLAPGQARATSGEDGMARLALPAQAAALIVARRGADTAILPQHGDWWYGGSPGWVRSEQPDALRWYVFDDRKMYRPGEEISLKGWLRRVGAGKGGDVGPLAGAASGVVYTVRDVRGNEIGKGAVRLNPLGGFDLRFKLPPTVNLGNVLFQLEAQGGNPNLGARQHYHYAQVQEFRRPEFEVTARASGAPHFVGGHAQATVAANYYAGGGLANAEVNWRVTASPTRYTPPNRGDYTFGKWVPWWGGRVSSPGGQTNVQTFQGKTDAAGLHRLRLDFDSVDPPQPSTVTAQASVTDVNRQRWAGTTTMLVHPSDLYVGLRSPRMFVQQGQPLVVESIVTDLDGRAVAGREVRMRAAQLEWTYKKGEWQQVESKVEECNVSSAADAVKCTFRPQAGGQYRVTARVIDDRERPNESELTLWVAGGRLPPKRNVEQESVELIPDRREYAPGETAEILVQAPFYPAEGVFTLRRSGLERAVHFRMEGPSHTLKFAVEEAFTPNVYAQVDLVGAAPRVNAKGEADDKLQKRPAFASGSLNLTVPPAARKLRVTATPRDKALEPGAETTVGVEVKDAAGRPVQGGELAVVVVDESVLSLTGYKLEDPLSVFYALRGPDVSDHHLRREIMLRDPNTAVALNAQELAADGRGTAGRPMPAAAPRPVSRGVIGGGRADNNMVADGAENEQMKFKSLAADEAVRIGEAGEEIRVRTDFNALAVFVPSVLTDSAGRAEVKVKVPDSLTRYRVMAVSVAGGKQFGSGESNITARMPLMVRPSAPRFLNFGDRFELPVVVQNQTDAPVVADVAVRAANAEFTEGQGRRVTVPANDRVEVRFPAAASMAGKARFQAGAVSGGHADAAQVELPVWTPATTEAFATYGEVDRSGVVVQPVKAPADVFKQFGGLEVQTSSTQLQALTDAVIYLVSYPFECSEQLASRVLGVAALRDVLTAFKAKELPTPEEMKAAVARDIKRLQAMQNDDGGFGFWRRGEESWPYVSIHVAHALSRAKEKGYDVPQPMLDKSKSYLRNVESHIPKRYGRSARNALVSYALYVRNRFGDRDAARARRVIAEEGLDKLSLESVGWLLSVLSGDAGSAAEVTAIRRLLGNRVEETAGAAHFTSRYGDDDYLLLASDRRADAVILEALIADQPQSELIPKIVRGLLAHKKKGRWENTQENVFVLLALDRYFGTYEKTTPDFVARAWLGDAYAGEQQFRGRSTDRNQFEVPMRRLAEAPGGAQQNLTIQKEGQGRLYYRIGMQYAPSSLKLAPADYGFTVERKYEAVDNPSDVRRDADGTWRVRAGAKVRVKLSLYAPARRYHVALVDPLPAGLEALNPALAVTEYVPQESKIEEGSFHRWWWSGVWYEHQNLRDERAEAFTSLLWEGVYTYAYTARATTPGTFVVPPPKAEEMYHPETFGRGATDRVVVE
ncbi:MAG TPA: alpha-2-macroglobulin family protein [Pyrinomonadaceae bacterium]|nr:alpha-2-macroglobulin family protein [Pyrinomonadaceae bacterium]